MVLSGGEVLQQGLGIGDGITFLELEPMEEEAFPRQIVLLGQKRVEMLATLRALLKIS